jgi:SWI/SNF-related matrix-associated actin-dependent regulator 1 of chromatin subfamily A
MLFPYQVAGVQYLKTHKQCCLFDDPGLGKTAQALHAIDPNQPVLIVCPASVKAVWQQEIKKWGIPLDAVACSGRGSFKYPHQGQVVITNPELLPDNPQLVWDVPRGLQVIVDEAHQYKSFTAKRSKLMRLISMATVANGGSVWFMTGTPILSTPKDLFGLLKSAGISDKTYRSWNNFTYYFKGVNTRFGWKFPAEPRPDALKPLDGWFLRRRKQEVLPDLPEKIFSEFYVESNFKEVLDLDEARI